MTKHAQAAITGVPPHGAPSLPTLVANIFTKLRLAQRVRVLRRLLLPVGPMALAVLGGGAGAPAVVVPITPAPRTRTFTWRTTYAYSATGTQEQNRLRSP